MSSGSEVGVALAVVVASVSLGVSVVVPSFSFGVAVVSIAVASRRYRH